MIEVVGVNVPGQDAAVIVKLDSGTWDTLKEFMRAFDPASKTIANMPVNWHNGLTVMRHVVFSMEVEHLKPSDFADVWAAGLKVMGML